MSSSGFYTHRHEHTGTHRHMGTKLGSTFTIHNNKVKFPIFAVSVRMKVFTSKMRCSTQGPGPWACCFCFLAAETGWFTSSIFATDPWWVSFVPYKGLSRCFRESSSHFDATDITIATILNFDLEPKLATHSLDNPNRV